MKKIIQYIRRGYQMKTALEKIGDKEYEVITSHGSILNIDGVLYEQITRDPKCGVIVATGKGKIGFSLLSPKENRKPNWKFAIELAEKRAEGITKNPRMPSFMASQYDFMFERSKRYFK